MPLYWKKSKVSVISRIVSDLPSPKHGNSLIGHNSFPTSIVDAFWKNHDRLKKPYSKNKKKHQNNNQHVIAADEIVINNDAYRDPLVDDLDPQSCDSIKNIEFIGSRVEEIQDEAEFLAAHGAQSKNDKSKRKIMKKLVPKKLRHRKKDKNVEVQEDDEIQPTIVVKKYSERREGSRLERSGGQPFSHHCLDKLLILDVLTEQVNEEQEVEVQKHRKQEGTYRELLEDKSGTLVAIEEQRRIDKKGNSSCLVIFLAILVGLAGGRILAFLLAIASCLMLKLVFGRKKRRINDKAMKGFFASFSK